MSGPEGYFKGVRVSREEAGGNPFSDDIKPVEVTYGDTLGGTLPQPFKREMEPGVTYFCPGPSPEVSEWVKEAIKHRSEHPPKKSK